MDNEKNYAQELKNNTRIKGWLLVLLVLFGACGIVGFVVPLTMLSSIDPFIKTMSVGLVINGLFYLFFACFVIYSFIKRKPNAVFLARTYVIYMLIFNVMPLLMHSGSNTNNMVFYIVGLLLDIYMLAYLSESNQVKTIIPKDYRKYKPINTWMIVLLVLIPIVSVIVAFTINNPDKYQKHRDMMFAIDQMKYTLPMAVSNSMDYVDVYYDERENNVYMVIEMHDMTSEDSLRYEQIYSDENTRYSALSNMIPLFKELLTYFEYNKIGLGVKYRFANSGHELLSVAIPYKKCMEIIENSETIEPLEEFAKNLSENECPLQVDEYTIFTQVEYNKVKQEMLFYAELTERFFIDGGATLSTDELQNVALGMATYIADSYRNEYSINPQYNMDNVKFVVVFKGTDGIELCRAIKE